MKCEISYEVKANILEFMKRADMKGREVDAYNASVKALSTPVEVESTPNASPVEVESTPVTKKK